MLNKNAKDMTTPTPAKKGKTAPVEGGRQSSTGEEGRLAVLVLEVSGCVCLFGVCVYVFGVFVWLYVGNLSAGEEGRHAVLVLEGL